MLIQVNKDLNGVVGSSVSSFVSDKAGFYFNNLVLRLQDDDWNFTSSLGEDNAERLRIYAKTISIKLKVFSNSQLLLTNFYDGFLIDQFSKIEIVNNNAIDYYLPLGNLISSEKIRFEIEFIDKTQEQQEEHFSDLKNVKKFLYFHKDNQVNGFINSFFFLKYDYRHLKQDDILFADRIYIGGVLSSNENSLNDTVILNEGIHLKLSDLGTTSVDDLKHWRKVCDFNLALFPNKLKIVQVANDLGAICEYVIRNEYTSYCGVLDLELKKKLLREMDLANTMSVLENKIYVQEIPYRMENFGFGMSEFSKKQDKLMHNPIRLKEV